MFIGKKLIPNPQFQSSRQSLNILNNSLRMLVAIIVSIKMGYGDISSTSLIILHCIYSDKINEQAFGNSWEIWSMVTTSFSNLNFVMSGDVKNPIFL